MDTRHKLLSRRLRNSSLSPLRVGWFFLIHNQLMEQEMVVLAFDMKSFLVFVICLTFNTWSWCCLFLYHCRLFTGISLPTSIIRVYLEQHGSYEFTYYSKHVLLSKIAKRFLKLFGFPTFRFWAYPMKVIPETRWAH